MSELGRFIRIAAPISLLAFALSGCGTTSAAPPTLADIQRSIPLPLIESDPSVVYTNSPRPVQVGIHWANTCGDDVPQIISPSGLQTSFKRGWWPQTGRVTAEGMNQQNKTYTLTFSAQNCTTYAGETVYSDTTRKDVNIVYDTIPPDSQITGIQTINGKLLITVMVTDNLSPVSSVKLQNKAMTGNGDGTYTIELTPTTVGNNPASVTAKDAAGNKATQYNDVEYNPFRDIQITSQTMDDGTMVFRTNVTDNIDPQSFVASGSQQYAPLIPAEITPNPITCGTPVTQSGLVEIRCIPPDTKGMVALHITIKDVNGFSHEEALRIKMDDIPLSRAIAFDMLYLMLGGLTAAGALKLIRRVIRASDLQRKQEIVAAVQNSDTARAHELLNTNTPSVFRGVADFLVRSRPTERDSLAQYIQDAENIGKLTQILLPEKEDLVEAYQLFKHVYSHLPKQDLMEKIDINFNKWQQLVAEELNQLIQSRNWKELRSYFIFAKPDKDAQRVINKIKSQPFAQKFDDAYIIALYTQNNIPTAPTLPFYKSSGEMDTYTRLQHIIDVLTQYGLLEQVNTILEKYKTQVPGILEYGFQKVEIQKAQEWISKIPGEGGQTRAKTIAEDAIKYGLTADQSKIVYIVKTQLHQFDQIMYMMGYKDEDFTLTEAFRGSYPTITSEADYQEWLLADLKRRLLYFGTSIAQTTNLPYQQIQLYGYLYGIVRNTIANMTRLIQIPGDGDSKKQDCIPFSELLAMYKANIDNRDQHAPPLITAQPKSGGTKDAYKLLI